MASEAVRVPEPAAEPVKKEGTPDDEAIESLRKEIERLKTRLEEERKKLNDVTCKALLPLVHSTTDPDSVTHARSFRCGLVVQFPRPPIDWSIWGT